MVAVGVLEVNKIAETGHWSGTTPSLDLMDRRGECFLVTKPLQIGAVRAGVEDPTEETSEALPGREEAARSRVSPRWGKG
jgi:hypothetical protein